MFHGNIIRRLSTCPSLYKSQSGRFRVSIKHDNPLTYEEAHKPNEIGVKKEFNSFNTANLRGSTPWAPNTAFGLWPSEISIQDIFIRKFVSGTWHDLFVSEIIIKRQGNLIRVGGIVRRGVHARKMYFLIGYTEELLSYWLQSVVKMEVQSCNDKKDVVFKCV